MGVDTDTSATVETEVPVSRTEAAREGESVESMIGLHYLDRLLRRGRHPASMRNFTRAWRSFEGWCTNNGVSPELAESWQLEEYFFGLAYAPTTKRMYMAQVRAAYRYAIRRGSILSDPTIDLEFPKVPETIVRTLTNGQLREIKSNCFNDRQWLMFHLFAYTGCRRNEIRELHWDQVNTTNNTIFVTGKFNKSRLIPIHPALGEVMSGFKQPTGKAVLGNAYGRPFHYTYYDDILKSFAPTATFHDFRRTVASSLDANGVEEGVIMKIMGWAPKTVFDRHYRNVAPERLQRAILKLYADDPL